MIQVLSSAGFVCNRNQACGWKTYEESHVNYKTGGEKIVDKSVFERKEWLNLNTL